MEQQIRFCTTADGVRIAYASVGRGPLVVRAAHWMTHLEYDWRPPANPFLETLASHCMLVRYDERGCGLSDRNIDSISFEAMVGDLESVVDAMGLDRFALLGMSQGGPVAVAYAVRHPEKVTRLILHGTYARGWAKRSRAEREEHEAQIAMMKTGWDKDNPAYRQVFASLFIPDATPEQVRQFNDWMRLTTSPENAARIQAAFGEIDVQDLLPKIAVPTLVFHSRRDARCPFEEGRRVAALIPSAKFIPLDSNNHMPQPGEPAREQMIALILEFLGVGGGGANEPAQSTASERTSAKVAASPEAATRVSSMPTGTITFLFTDVEGSTTLLQRLGDRRYAEVLEEHRRLLRDAFTEGNGQEVDTQGDAFLIAFPRARSALASAVAGQLALTKHTWPDGTSLRVRMGLHTGEPVTETGDYVGLDVHRAARICAAGHGGQILLSDAVSVLAARDLPGGVTLKDLGIHRLKDLQEPEHLFQVVHPDLPVDFPSLKSLDVAPTNLSKMRPQTKYARSGDIRVAYQITGSGPIDVVRAPGTVSHLELEWEIASRAPFIEWLSTICRLIRFDKRGTGLSDRPTHAATLEERTDDIRAVMDAAASDRAVIFGQSEGASMACLFAATYPERTRSLIVWGGQARWVQSEDYPWGLTPAEHKRMVEHVREHWPSVEYVTGVGAGYGHDVDPAVLEFMLRAFQAAASPSAVAALEEMNAQIDVRDILPTIRVPTLVMNRTGDPAANVDAARDLAAHIPGARFVEFPGTNHQIVGLEFDRIRAEIEHFIKGNQVSVETDRFLATLLFVEAVKSDHRHGTREYAIHPDLLRRYQALIDVEVQRYKGVEVDKADCRLLARFDGPGRAIRCAIAVRNAAGQIGMNVRSGIHIGECELMGDKLGGTATHVASNIMTQARPGEVLVSRTVKDLVAGSGFEFHDRGVHKFKGIPARWHLFRV